MTRVELRKLAIAAALSGAKPYKWATHEYLGRNWYSVHTTDSTASYSSLTMEWVKDRARLDKRMAATLCDILGEKAHRIEHDYCDY